MSIPGNANPLLLRSAGTASAGISRSLRFNSSDSAYLSRGPASAGNSRTWTWAGWVKRCRLGNIDHLFNGVGSGSPSYSMWYFFSDDQFKFDGGGVGSLSTAQVFRDFSAWYHIVLAFDTTQATPADRIKLYINGSQVTAFSSSSYPTQNADGGLNQAGLHKIGNWSAEYSNFYLADVYLIDGQALTPSSFTETDATTGQLIPKAYTGSYGTNGFHLEFADNSAATATTLGKDTSGNGNNWTPNNLSVTAGAGNDSLVDVPTNGSQTDTGVGGEVRGNYCTMNPLDAASGAALSLTNGNLEHTNPSTAWKWRRGTFAMTTGKWYWEQTVSLGATASEGYLAGVATAAFDFNIGTGGLYARQSGTKYENGTTTSSVFSSTTAGDILGFAFDADSGKLWVSQNGTFVGSPTAGTGNSWASVPVGVFPLFAAYNVSGNIMNFGQRPFAYTAPSGFKALCSANLPAPLVTKPSTVMDVALYTGNGSARSITGLGFNPDLVWIKSRSAATDHELTDSVRGTTKSLSSNLTAAEATDTGGLTAFNSDGFSLGTDTKYNNNAATYVAWAWDAGSSTVTNNAGSITSSVRANATAGFSIVSLNAATGTYGHGLGVVPRFIISRARNRTTGWLVYHSSATSVDQYLTFDTNSVQSAAGLWGSITSTTIGMNLNLGFLSGDTVISYCFAPVVGYSSFGSYTGNGSSDGPFVFTGMRPRWIIFKRTDTAENWTIYDTARDTYNAARTELFAHTSGAENAGSLNVDILSNGFKIRNTNGSFNASGGTYIYAAFAESPLNYARAR